MCSRISAPTALESGWRHLRASLRRMVWRETPLQVSCSLSSCRAAAAVSCGRLYREADWALYDAKRAGKGRHRARSLR